MSVTQPDATPLCEDWSSAFDAICDRHRGRLIRWLTSIFGARDAEDIAQEALARLYMRPGFVDPNADAWPWLAVVARNVGRDMARHNAMSTSVDHDMLADVADEVTVADVVLARDEADRLARALRSLSARERTVIRLRDFEGAGIPDIAEILGTNENAVRQQLFRARRRLAGLYVSLGGERRIGLAALLGLRWRNWLNRNAASANAVGAVPATMMAAALPAMVAAVATAMTSLPSVQRVSVHTATARYDLAASGDLDSRHGLLRRVSGTTSSTSRPSGAARTVESAPAIVTASKTVGGAGADIRVYSSPTGKAGGKTNEQHVWVDVPVETPWGRVRVYLDHVSESDPGYGPVCSTEIVNCG